MNKFTEYLIKKGIHKPTAKSYNRMVNEFLKWVESNELKIGTLKRTQFTDYLQICKERGNTEGTIKAKENVARHYYNFLGLKNNPAKPWLKKTKEYKLPPKALSKKELVQVYDRLNPKSPAEYRNRRSLGFILFQGLLRTQLSELRISDVDLQKCEVFVLRIYLGSIHVIILKKDFL